STCTKSRSSAPPTTPCEHSSSAGWTTWRLGRSWFRIHGSKRSAVSGGGKQGTAWRARPPRCQFKWKQTQGENELEKGLIFTYLLTYGGAAASLYRPFYGLLVYICFAIVRPEAMWYWAVPEGNYSRIVAIALLVGWALHGFGSWKLGRAKGVVVALI